MTENGAGAISSFFAGRSIFVTGGTGFMGKVLIEKLLRSCPEIREIYLLMRPRKGIGMEDRLRKVLQNSLFDGLRERNPTVFEKLIPINGNTSLPELGMLPEDRQLIIERVSVIFNLAGNIRFDNNLKDHIITNTMSIRTLCILAESMKNLVAFVHVSTAYTQCDKQTIEEIEYPPITDWKKTVKTVEALDEKTLMILGQKYSGIMPNTYTFSKRLAEDVLSAYRNRLPIVLIRPSVVVSSASEPFPGWIDGFQGQGGMMAGFFKGFVRVMLADGNITLDDMPVDVSIKIIIAAAWKRGLEPLHVNPELAVYNCTAAEVKGAKLHTVMTDANIIEEGTPMGFCLWYPDMKLIPNPLLFSILSIFLHLIPATVIDILLKLTGRKPMLSKLQIMVQGIGISVQFFCLHQFYIRNGKAMSLLAEQTKRDEGFGFDLPNIDVLEFGRHMMWGVKKYLLREDVTKLKEARIHLTRMWWLDRIFKTCLLCFFAWILYRWGLFDCITSSYYDLIMLVSSQYE